MSHSQKIGKRDHCKNFWVSAHQLMLLKHSFGCILHLSEVPRFEFDSFHDSHIKTSETFVLPALLWLADGGQYLLMKLSILISFIQQGLHKHVYI